MRRLHCAQILDTNKSPPPTFFGALYAVSLQKCQIIPSLLQVLLIRDPMCKSHILESSR